jgi:hypothetical protein
MTGTTIQWFIAPPSRSGRPKSASSSCREIDVVRAGFEEAAQRQHDDQRRHAEGDDDRGQHQRLRQRIGIAGAPAVMIGGGRSPAGPSRTGTR